MQESRGSSIDGKGKFSCGPPHALRRDAMVPKGAELIASPLAGAMRGPPQ